MKKYLVPILLLVTAVGMSFTLVERIIQTKAQQFPFPLIARHPTCPVIIYATRNVNVTKPNYWQDVEIDVQNISPKTVTKAIATLTWITDDQYYTMTYSADTPLLPGQTATLKRQFPGVSKEFQTASEQASKAFFDVEWVYFEDRMWLTGRYHRPVGMNANGEKTYAVDETMEKKMFEQMNIPADWRRSKELDDYWRTVDRDTPASGTNTKVSKAGSQQFLEAGCNYHPGNNPLQRQCPSRCGGSINVDDVQIGCFGSGTFRECYRTEVSTVECGGLSCYTQRSKLIKCNSANTN